MPSQLLTKRRKTLGNVTNVCHNTPTSSVVQQMSLPVREPKKILRKENTKYQGKVSASVETSMSLKLHVDENHELQHQQNVNCGVA